MTMQKLRHIYREPNRKSETTFEQKTEDDINVILLTADTNVLFNEKKNSIKIVKDQTNSYARTSANDKAFHQQQHTRMDSTTILLKNKTLVLPRYGNFSVFVPSSQLRCFPAISINML